MPGTKFVFAASFSTRTPSRVIPLPHQAVSETKLIFVLIFLSSSFAVPKPKILSGCAAVSSQCWHSAAALQTFGGERPQAATAARKATACLPEAQWGTSDEARSLKASKAHQVYLNSVQQMVSGEFGKGVSPA